MFTGLIQTTGIWEKFTAGAEAGSLTLKAGPWTPLLTKGESIAVDGVCLTVVDFTERTVRFDVLMETLHRTSFGERKPGDWVNLERALRLGDSMGGHIVSGHVDGTGTVRSLTRAGRDWIVEIACSDELLNGIVPKGSIALDGISLTIAELRSESFTVHIIPHTWESTSLSQARVGRQVNLETDMIGKYVARYLKNVMPSRSLHIDALKNAGFIE
jgi:riboflavin synthase